MFGVTKVKGAIVNDAMQEAPSMEALLLEVSMLAALLLEVPSV